MSSGRQGAVDLPAATLTTVVAPPASGYYKVVTLWLTNRTAQRRTVRVALIDGSVGDVAAEDYLFYDTPIEPNQPLAVVTGVVMSATDRLAAYADAAGVNAIAWAVEEVE